MRFLNITRGVVPTAKKVVIYGPEGIGKSSLASKFPEPLFLDVEGSTKALDVARVENITEWAVLRSFLQDLAQDPQGFKTVVIDTADWAERLCTNHICRRDQKKGIEDYGYGKGFTYLRDEFATILIDCDALIRKGVNVVFTAHAMMRKFEQPDERGSYDRWELKLSKHNSPMLKEWADMVLFCNYRTHTEKQENGSYKVVGGERVMYTTHNPCWDAKNRYGLDDAIKMDYGAIAHVIDTEPMKKEEKPLTVKYTCSDCGKEIEGFKQWSAKDICERSIEKFGRALCMDCAKKAKSEKEGNDENDGR